MAIEAYTPLTLSSDKASSYLDTTAAKRQTYIYKLSVTKNGVTKEFETPSSPEPFADTVTTGITVTVASSTKTLNAIPVTLTPVDTTLGHLKNSDLSAEVWRQETSAGGVPIGAAVKVSTTDLTLTSPGNFFEDTGLTLGKYYKYKLVLKSTAGTMAAVDTLYGDNTSGVAPSAAGAAFYSRFSGVTATSVPGDSLTFVYKVLTGTATTNNAPLLNGAKLYKLTKSASTSAARGELKFVWSTKTEGPTIRYRTSEDPLDAPYAGVGRYDSYFAVSAVNPTPDNVYGEDIYFALGNDGLPYTYNNQYVVVKITRNANSAPTASQLTTIAKGDIKF